MSPGHSPASNVRRSKPTLLTVTTAIAGLVAVTALGRWGGGHRMSAASPGDRPSVEAKRRAPQEREGRSGPSDADRSGDLAPGQHGGDGTDVAASVRSYLIGLGLAALLTAGSFLISWTDLIYQPVVAVALVVFAIAQVGVHLVFFLHLTTSPDNINNALALAFGVLIVFVLIGGTIWIMFNMNANMAHQPFPTQNAMPMKGMSHH